MRFIPSRRGLRAMTGRWQRWQRKIEGGTSAFLTCGADAQPPTVEFHQPSADRQAQAQRKPQMLLRGYKSLLLPPAAAKSSSSSEDEFFLVWSLLNESIEILDLSVPLAWFWFW